jgi:Xaa-Pro aminopeptidase
MSDKLKELRKLMTQNGLQAYIIPSTDPHSSEYVPEFWQRRKYISGFTGSAGDVVVTRNKAALWTDSRYFLQAEKQLDPKDYILFKLGQPEVPRWEEWLSQELKEGETVGFDPWLVSHKSYLKLNNLLDKKGIKLKGIYDNLVDKIWEGRPEAPAGKVEIYPLSYAGESVEQKLNRLRQKMNEEGAQAMVITTLDALAWLFNLRGSDVTYNPVFIANAVVTSQKAYLFVDPKKTSSSVKNELKRLVEFRPYEEFKDFLKALKEKKCTVWLDDNTVSRAVTALLEKGARLIFKPLPIYMLKAIKNPVEIDGFRKAHHREGIALVKFFFWLDRKIRNGERITELGAAKKIEELRSSDALYRGPSFQTISSFGTHGAIVHYAVDEESDTPFKSRGIYLLDCGGQYLDATTDITRTVAFGEPTSEQKEIFTRVLKGLIDLSRIRFPVGTVGKQLDTVSRLSLWEIGANFGHGTGHGVGHFLAVHEGPQAISYYRCQGIALEPGMVVTIEPGFYKENEYGIRVENMALVVKDESPSLSGEFLKFETLSLCPIDLKLIEKNLLTSEEINWLNDYHKRVREELTSELNEDEGARLISATRPI